jgi:hypothetical protein
MRAIFFFIFLSLSLFSTAQREGRIWCFGDSAGIDFNNLNNPVPINSIVRSRGSCVSIADSLGNLKCYASCSEASSPQDTKTVQVYNSNNLIIENGDSIVGLGWYKELLMLPFPNHSNLYYLLSIGVTLNYGIYFLLLI